MKKFSDYLSYSTRFLLIGFLVFTSLFPFKLIAQDICVAPTCNKLAVEVIRQEGDVNTGPTCSIASPYCGDAFRQLTYKVFLRYQASDTTPFFLNYSELLIPLKLRNNSTPQLSHINIADTDSCFVNGIGADWSSYSNSNGDEVIFDITKDMAAISFQNYDTSSTDCGSNGSGSSTNRIRFTFTPPNNANTCSKCAYAELFTIVVNAYAGEQIGFVVDSTHIIYKSRGGTPCQPVNSETSGPRCGFINSSVSYPDTLSTVNDDLLANFSTITSNNDGSESFSILIKNNGASSMTVNYVEFTLTASLSNAVMTFSGVDPQVYPGPLGTQLLHYIIPITGGVSIGAGASASVCTITVAQNGLINMGWSYNFTFQGIMATRPKTRISSSSGCTALNTTTNSKGLTHDGDLVCSDPTVHFTIESEAISCDSLKVRVGLISTNPHLVNIKLSRMKFVLRFSWNVPGISITGVDYGNWPSGICSTYGDYNWPPLSCYQIGPSDSTYGVFSYGYATFDSLAPAFSLTPSEHMDILFSIPTNGCIDSVKLESLSLTYVGSDYTPCVPEIDDPIGFPLCGLSVKGLVTTKNGDGVKDVTIKLEAADTTSCSGLICTDTCALNSTPTGLSGSYGFCNYCTACNYLKVTPYKNDNPLNGLTTYDLVLISKHILGIEALDSPFKLIAADANKGGSITTNDIVEFRKLILGIYNTLPNNTSWRFMDKSYVFPDTLNPWLFPDSINCITPSSTNYDFYAIKVGDVNYTAALNRPASRPLTTLTWPVLRSSKNGYITVPVSYSGVEPLEALQFGLRFDPSKLQLMATTKGDIESYNNQWFNNLHADEGEIKTLWLSMSDLPDRIEQGNILFYLTFKVLDNQDAELPLWLDDQLLEGAAWTPVGTEFALGQSATPANRESTNIPLDIQASIRPNPTDHTAWLEISTSKAEKARVALYDASGKRIFMRAVQLTEGKQEIALPEVATLSSGVYVWKVITPRNSTQGHLIKQ